MIHRLLIAENKQVFFWVTCMLRIFSFSSKTENSVISRLGEKSSDKIRAPWIFVQIRNLNINLFDVLRSLENSFSTRCCCRTRYCVTGGHRGWWVWTCWDPFEGHETLFLFALPLLVNPSVLLIIIQTYYIQNWPEIWVLVKLPTWSSYASKRDRSLF